MRTIYPIACILLPTLANAQVVINQQPSIYDLGGGMTGRVGAISDDFTDVPDLNTYCFDDFTTTSTWLLSTITCYGIDSGGAGGTPHLRIQLNRDHVDPLVLYSSDGIGLEMAGDWHIGLPGFALTAGTYWVTFWVTRDFGSQGQWLWAHSNVNQGPPPSGVRGSEYYIQNPASGSGGGRGWGTGDAIPGSDPRNRANPNDPRDLAFRISVVNIAEPSTFVAIAAGLATLLRLRRKSNNQ